MIPLDMQVNISGQDLTNILLRFDNEGTPYHFTVVYHGSTGMQLYLHAEGLTRAIKINVSFVPELPSTITYTIPHPLA